MTTVAAACRYLATGRCMARPSRHHTRRSEVPIRRLATSRRLDDSATGKSRLSNHKSRDRRDTAYAASRSPRIVVSGAVERARCVLSARCAGARKGRLNLWAMGDRRWTQWQSWSILCLMRAQDEPRVPQPSPVGASFCAVTVLATGITSSQKTAIE